MKLHVLAALLLTGCNGQLRFEDDVAAAPVTDAGVDAEPAKPEPQDAAAPDTTNTTPVTPKGCLNDSNCALSALHCDAVSGSCVECTSDAHCTNASTPRCDAALHRCVECGIDADCGADKRCEPTTRRCVRVCQRLDQCDTESPLCDFEEGFCRRCHTNIECLLPPGQQHCDEANGKCSACVEDEHCPTETPYCDRTRGTCAACLDSAHCPGGNCDPLTRTCTIKSGNSF